MRANVNSLASLAEAWDSKTGAGMGTGSVGGGVEDDEGGNPLYLALFQDCIMPESKLQPCMVSSSISLLQPRKRGSTCKDLIDTEGRHRTLESSVDD